MRLVLPKTNSSGKTLKKLLRERFYLRNFVANQILVGESLDK
jgi:hypothetical protein